MIPWTIISNNQEDVIQIGPCTYLMQHSAKWFQLTRDINDFFNTRSSTVKIIEGMSHVVKTDWNCYFIPYDAHIQLEKITSKSPLLPLIEKVIEDLKYSPLYYEISELWDSWNLEVEFSNQQLDEYELSAKLRPFEEIDLKAFIQLESFNLLQSPLDVKLLLLRLINSEAITKKNLIILEYPEMFATTQQKKELNCLIQQMVKRGMYFLIVSADQEIAGVKNYHYNNNVINEIQIMSLQRKVTADAPFYVDDILYNKAKSLLMLFVDKVVKNEESKGLIEGYQQEVQVLLYMMLRNLKMDQTIDLVRFPPNIIKFIESY